MSKLCGGSRTMKACGLAGSMILASLLTARGQEAASSPQPAAPSAQACSGIFCVFTPIATQSTPVASEPATAPQDPASTPQVAADDTTDAPAKAKPKARPVHPITIAADAADVGRLQALAAMMPKARIKIVAGHGAGADFSVSTAFDPADRPAGAAKAKLFIEQMHVVASGAITSMTDLDGKVVSFGADNSASQAAGRKAFQALNIHVKETPLELDNALDGLSTGDIDAVVILAPQPVARLKGVSAPGVHFLSWPDGKAPPSGTVVASIDTSAYPSLGKSGLGKSDLDKSGGTVAALGVDAVLTLSPKSARLPAAKTFLAALSQHSNALSKHGFDLLKADIESRTGRRVASVERR